jgi:hypothetical protein
VNRIFVTVKFVFFILVLSSILTARDSVEKKRIIHLNLNWVSSITILLQKKDSGQESGRQFPTILKKTSLKPLIFPIIMKLKV